MNLQKSVSLPKGQIHFLLFVSTFYLVRSSLINIHFMLITSTSSFFLATWHFTKYLSSSLPHLLNTEIVLWAEKNFNFEKRMNQEWNLLVAVCIIMYTCIMFLLILFHIITEQSRNELQYREKPSCCPSALKNKFIEDFLGGSFNPLLFGNMVVCIRLD